MNQTAMQQLLAQLKDERVNRPMEIEWDRCYQAIEMVIVNTYIPMEKEQIIDAHIEGFYSPPFERSRKGEAEQYYNQTYNKDK